MREIKFRAWDKYGNTMRLVKSINYADDGFAKTILVRLVGGITFGYVHGESCELMQYTGLKDKNGKEIYEGDIVRVMRDDYEQHVVCYDIHQAKYKTVPFGAYTANAGNGGWTGYELRGYGEVIGNIYEHPELLHGS